MLMLVRINVQIPAVGHLGSAGIALWFLLVPDVIAARHGLTLFDWGLHLHGLRSALGWSAVYAAVITPIFIVAFVGFYEVVCQAPGLAELAPRGMCGAYLGIDGAHWPVLPDRFGEFVLVQLLVVALPEELFFRGMMLGLLGTSPAGAGVPVAAPPRLSRMVAGVPLDRAIWLSSLMFALVHLPKDGDPRALATFFPALAFAWLRVKTGSLVAPILAHAYSNILVRLLELSLLR